jgi:ABC-2 type transport system permease protein
MDSVFIMRTFWASMISSLKMVVRYVSVAGLIAFNLAVPLFYVFTSGVISTFMPQTAFFPSKTGMTDYMSYLSIGFAFSGFIFSAAFGGSQAIRGEQEHGTAELVFMTPANKASWLLGKMMGQLIFGLINFSVILLSGFFLFGFHPEVQPNIPFAILSIVLTMLSMTSFGFVYAGVCFLAKREEELSQVLWPMITFFSGLAFPVEILPEWGKIIARMIPLTWGIDATRKALLLGAGISDPSQLIAIGILSLLTMVLLPIGAVLFSRLEEAAKKTGTLGTY